MSRRHPGRYVLRSVGAVAAFWVGVGVLAIIIVSSLAQAQWHLVLFEVPPALLLAWAFWLVLYRPSLWWDSERVVVVNVARTFVLPWGRVVDVRQGIGLLFDLDSGKKVQSVGAPTPRRTGLIAGALDRRTRPPRRDPQENADILNSVRQAAIAGDDPVSAKWEVVPLVVGGVLAVAVALEFAFRI